jgi:hypothetical protein
MCGPEETVMIKMTIGLLVLLAISVAVGIWRKSRGGSLLPPPIDGEELRPRTWRSCTNNRKMTGVRGGHHCPLWVFAVQSYKRG